MSSQSTGLPPCSDHTQRPLPRFPVEDFWPACNMSLRPGLDERPACLDVCWTEPRMTGPDGDALTGAENSVMSCIDRTYRDSLPRLQSQAAVLCRSLACERRERRERLNARTHRHRDAGQAPDRRQALPLSFGKDRRAVTRGMPHPLMPARSGEANPQSSRCKEHR